MSRQSAILGPGTKIGGKYEVVEVVGFGGMGVVYKVREQVGAVSRIRALKTVLPQHADDPNIVTRFREEAEKMCLLEHENIVPVLSYSEEGQFPYLIMPFIEGRTLKEYLAAHVGEHGRPLPLGEVMEIGLEVIRGLEVAHHFVDPQSGRPAPMVHRDIKPGNVMIRVEDRGGERRLKILIMDFGIAKVVSEEDTGHSLTGVIGTVRYASPEQVRRSKDIDPRADIYSLGMVLYELYTGRHMFADLTEYAVLLRMMEKETKAPEPEFPEGTPPSFRELVVRAVAPDRAQRFGSVAEMRTAMRRILDQDSERASEEAHRAEEAARTHREQALERNAPELAPAAFEDAETLLRRAQESEDTSHGIRFFRAAALAFEQATEQAVREQERRRVAEGLSRIDPLRQAAREAQAPELAPTAVGAAEKATEAAKRALDEGEVTTSARALEEAERLWREAEAAARREARRREAEETLGRLREAVASESVRFDDLPTVFCPPEGLERLAEARSSLEEASAAAERGDFTRAGAAVDAGGAAIDQAAKSRAAAFGKLGREAAGLERRVSEAFERLDQVEARELAGDLHREALARIEAARAATGEEGRPGRAFETWQEAASALERLATSLGERREERERARREAEQRAKEAEARAREEGERAEREARAARERAEQQARAARETAEKARDEARAAPPADETVADAFARGSRSYEEAERLFGAERWAEATASFEQAAKTFRETVRLDREVLAGRFAGLRRQARAIAAELASLSGEIEGGDTELARLQHSLEEAERRGDAGDVRSANEALGQLSPQLGARVEALRKRIELERARERALEARGRARAALETATRLGEPATDDEAFSVARKRIDQGERHVESSNFEMAERELTAAALALDQLTRQVEEALRTERLEGLQARRREVEGSLPQTVRGWKLRRRRKRVVASLDRTAREIEAGREDEATRLLAECETLTREIVAQTPRSREVPAARRGPWVVAAGAGVVAAAAGAVLLSRQVPVGGGAPSLPTPRADVRPPVETPSTRVAAAPSPAPATPVTLAARPQEPEAAPTMAPVPTVAVAPTVVAAPTAAAPKATEPPAIVLGRAEPATERIGLARLREQRFEASVRGVAPAGLTWELDGKAVGTGEHFTLGKERSARPGDHRLELVVGRGADRRVLRAWRIEVQAEPIRFASLEPRGTTLERAAHEAVSFRAPVTLGGGDQPTFFWEVNGQRVTDARGPSYRFAPGDSGEYRVRVRAVAPWGASVDNEWRVVLHRVEPTPAPVDPRRELLSWIDTYCRAYERADIDTLIAIGSIRASQAEPLRKALTSMRNLELRCTNPAIDVRGDAATISFDRTDRWTDPRGRSMEQSPPRISKELRRQGDRWVAIP